MDALAPGLLDGAAPHRALLLLLVAGHLLGDFLFPMPWIAGWRRKGYRALASHVPAVAAVHLVVLLPFLGWPVVAAVAVIAFGHAAIDLFESRSARRRRSPLALFALDQAGHGLVLLGVYLVLAALAAPLSPRIPEWWLRAWTLGAVVGAGFAFTWTGGGAIVSAVLTTLSPGLEEEEEESSGVRGSGRLIGELERTIALVLILLGQWAAVVILLIAKSIARFEELKERRFAEYYLVGTLTSLLVAFVTGLVLSLVLFGGVR